MYDEQHTDLPDTVCMRAKASAPPEAPSRTRHVARDRSAQEAPAAAPTPDARTRLLDAAERLFAEAEVQCAERYAKYKKMAEEK